MVPRRNDKPSSRPPASASLAFLKQLLAEKGDSEIRVLQAQLIDAATDARKWLSIAQSEEERHYVHKVQVCLGNMQRILDRVRIQHRIAPGSLPSRTTESNWSQNARAFINALGGAEDASGHVFGTHLKRLAARLEEQIKTSAKLPDPDAAKGAPNKRERGPDYQRIQKRVDFEDKLVSELGMIQSKISVTASINLALLKREFPDFELWKLLSQQQQEELLTEDFKPRMYARTLAMAKFGLTSRETIKKDRQRLRKRTKF